MINSKQLQVNIDVKKIVFVQVQVDLNCCILLGVVNFIGCEELQYVCDIVVSVQVEFDVVIQQYNVNQVIVLGIRLEQQLVVFQVVIEVCNVWLVLQCMQIVSLISGYVFCCLVQSGVQIGIIMLLMVVVLVINLWIDVNFKEIQLVYMCIGQLVIVISDIYGDDVKYIGKVVGLDMGIGSVFFLLLVQNVIGNWIKVVQCLLVCIELDEK